MAEYSSEEEIKRSWKQEKDKPVEKSWQQEKKGRGRGRGGLLRHAEESKPMKLLQVQQPVVQQPVVVTFPEPGQFDDVEGEEQKPVAVRRKTHSVKGVLVQRDTPCPVKGCGKVDRKLRKHIAKVHLSPLFDFTPGERRTDEFHLKQRDVARQLAKWIVGPNRTLSQLRGFIQKSVRLPSLCEFSKEAYPSLRRMCDMARWSNQPRFYLHPVNSAALITYWRVGASLLPFLTGNQCTQLRTLEVEPVTMVVPCIPAGSEEVDEEEEGLVLNVMVETPEDSNNNLEKETVPVLPVVDAGAVTELPTVRQFVIKNCLTHRKVGVVVSSLKELELATRRHFRYNPVYIYWETVEVRENSFLMSLPHFTEFWVCDRDDWVTAYPQ
ncbi:unnamed protein product [Mytilus coruscus]|uniref:Uncharacterized protein n=1 Tax=Mytilus coruscus TaxID=42192 RepID=A0A6J8EHV7_MYTCO|nr:unnamed protein product [Mytilus coruscus]